MASIFRKDDNFVEKPNRNSFDMSFQNNLTTKFGVLKPVYCQEVIPGDTFKIKPTFALRFLPQVFPVQTRMRAHLHFFYVRNRNLWKDWEDFIGKTRDGLVPPYISFNEANKSMLRVSGIADSFGVPVVTNSNVSQSFTYAYKQNSDSTKANRYFDFATGTYLAGSYGNYDTSYGSDYSEGVPYLFNLAYKRSSAVTSTRLVLFNGAQGVTPTFNADGQFVISVSQTSSSVPYSLIFADPNGTLYAYKFTAINGSNTIRLPRLSEQVADDPNDMATTFSRVEIAKVYGVVFNASSNQNISLYVVPSDSPNGIDVTAMPLGTSFPYSAEGVVNENQLKISALPFRAYEAIYNSFYRNAENNPFLINGVPEYNKYNRTYEGGADTNNYELFNRNWEDDFLTTALPSPQQGTAPLVGITNRGDAPYIVTLTDDDGNASRVKFSYVNGAVQVTSDDANSEEIAGQLNEYMMEQTNVGFTIADFRNVNSFTRWLENNIRRGFKYRDQIKGHFGVSVRYDILDMPEFIGGVSRDVSVTQITQTVENAEGNLGDIAGQSYVMGDGERISHFADEHGYIIGILSVVPMSNYSQMIPKHLLKTDALQYYFPEFGKIGMQPILNKEVTTLESISRGNQNGVFGYQRPWYDMIARVDEVHGLFTTQFRDFLVGRVFKDVPQLSASFSTIQSDQLNNIFYTDDDEDKILGQIYFDVTGIRPIPLYGIPSIE